MIEAASHAGRRGALVMACGILAACASSGTVVLLPEKDGKPAALTVKQGDKEVVLDQPYAAAKATAFGPRPYTSSAQEVQSQFGSALAAQPPRPIPYTLYFVEGKDEFTDESKILLEQVLSQIKQHPVPDVLVVGHTDTVGNDQYNDALGQRRADAVRAVLINFGIAETDIRAISRGKRELAVPTADGVAEPRNRRVEIIVR
ncbi:MAG TPA: OmpA family protein [Casimicrobiaceae bacterium]|nr:OmpA family protein [Casimicrobiaceae bacterium]